MSITAFRQHKLVTEARNELMPFLKECELAGYDVAFNWHPQAFGAALHLTVAEQVAVVSQGLVWIKVVLGHPKKYSFEYSLGEDLNQAMKIHSGQTDDVEELKDVISERMRSESQPANQ
jgi:hypothetical protein